ncbi:uncharacterized protein LOC122265692 [Penaeus japonicus]|uniref:uncharacterized protein LOC122265692 n=1 Tax=Penaeus japonicus TaxID=27405 RepID=UPI001C70E72A|nr:uncharacterized protein LOC122265692 [Penaeus japonicus]
MQVNKVLVGCIYRLPHSSPYDFLNSLSEVLNTIQREKSTSYLIGDFNIDLLKHTHSKDAVDLISLFHSHFHYCTITHNTRVTTNTATLLDQIWTNDIRHNLTNGIVYSSVSDHFPVFSFFQSRDSPKTPNTTVIKFRDFSAANLDNFLSDVENVDWLNCLTSTEVDEGFSQFHDKFYTIFSQYFPIKHKKIKTQHLNKPYITYDIKQLIKEKNSIGNNKKTWDIINTVLNRKSQTSLQALSPDVLNSYFANSGEALASKLATTEASHLHYLDNPLQMYFSPRLYTESEICNIVRESRDSSAGNDDIPMSIIKKSLPHIIQALTYFCNRSLQTGMFPSCLRIARVVPIHKGGSLHEPKCYRPVSVLAAFGKIFETMMYDRMIEFCNYHNILSNFQFGFRAQRSSESALQCFTNYVLRAFDDNEFLISVFLDLSKAFDTVNHQILIDKLHYYRFRGPSLRWFQSYLSNRMQYVSVNGQSSIMLPVNYGVPQGSVLGPLLFNMYINDMPRSSFALNYVLFADDCTMYISDRNIDILMDKMNKELVNINTWLTANKLTINPIWGGASSTSLNPLVVLQKKVIRNIMGLKTTDHTNESFVNLKLLKCNDIYTFKRLMETRPPLVSSSQSQSHIRYRGAVIFNGIPPEIKSKHTLGNFKSSLKSYLINSYTA